MFRQYLFNDGHAAVQRLLLTDGACICQLGPGFYKSDPGGYVRRVHCQYLLKAGNRPVQRNKTAFIDVLQGLQVQVVGVNIGTCKLLQTHFIFTQQGDTQSLGDLVCDFILYRKDIVQVPVIGFRPQVVSVLDIDQLRGDAHTVTLVVLAHAAFEDRLDTQFFTDIPQVLILALEGERGGAPGHPQFFYLGQDIEQFLAEPIGEILVVAIGAHVYERQYGNRLFVVFLLYCSFLRCI